MHDIVKIKGTNAVQEYLVNEIQELVTDLLKQHVIDKFFFIRYADPDYHLRVRFHLQDRTKIQQLIQFVNQRLRFYIDERLVWNVCADTYSREVERYGRVTIIDMESLFFMDSLSVISFLKETENGENDTFRWLWGLKCVDLLLGQFDLSLEQKADFFGMLNSSYSNEFNMNTPMKVQLDTKYRAEQKKIREVINSDQSENLPGLKHIYIFIKHIEQIALSIRKKEESKELDVSLNNLLSSIVHMHFNRLFRTKQRINELVVYYFMHKFYTSELARQKYSLVQ